MHMKFLYVKAVPEASGTFQKENFNQFKLLLKKENIT